MRKFLLVATMLLSLNLFAGNPPTEVNTLEPTEQISKHFPGVVITQAFQVQVMPTISISFPEAEEPIPVLNQLPVDSYIEPKSDTPLKEPPLPAESDLSLYSKKTTSFEPCLLFRIDRPLRC